MAQFDVVELTSARYTATLNDDDGNAIQLNVITAAALTLKDVTSGAVINSRSAQNVLNANNVTIHATSGLLTWLIQPADNTISDTSKANELHRAVFDISYGSGKRLLHEVDLLVDNVSYVTS